ncbi:MAG: cobalamin biosynthesis protein CobW [Ruminococcaceae bacterium]|nr:cobalamin biosynthesis protein CobW [Oscillospiraceae bacterium]
MTKIDIFSGFLGAGKTTLIKKLIKEAYAGEKVVLIENEFGEIGIDGGFLQDAGIEITEMNSGCICCSLVGDFTKALAKVLDEYKPDRVIIEPSGVGKLSDIIKAVEKLDSPDAMLNCFTTVADAGKCRMYMRNFGEFYNDQISHASAIFLSHTDKASDKKIEEAVNLIREHNSDAVIITTPYDKLDGKDILAAMEHKDTLEDTLKDLEKEAHHHHKHGHHHHHHDDEEECSCGCHEHEHHHHHDDDEECSCGCHEHEHHHHHHDDDEECSCGCHEHEHHHHHHDDDEECNCGCHEHEHHHHHHDDDEECSCGCHEHDHEHEHHHHHHADEVFASVGVETTHKFTIARIEEILEMFDEDSDLGMILRAKGIVESEDGSWIHFDYVPGDIDVRHGSAGVIGRLCVIGSGIDKEKIKGIFGV